MKSTIIFLGLAALSFTTANAANEFKSLDLDQQELTTLNVEKNQVNQFVAVNLQAAAINSEYSPADVAIFSPDSIMKASFVKTTQDIISENKLITESKDETVQPLSIDTAMEDRIAENNQIIESTISNVMYPLDFEKINRTVKSTKVYNNAIITSDIKL